MADDELHEVQTAFGQNQRPLEPRPNPSEHAIHPRSLTPTTTTVEVILSDTSGLHTTLEEVILTTFLSPLQHVLATPPSPATTPTQLVRAARLNPPSSPGMTTILNLTPAAESLLFPSPPATRTQTVPTGTLSVTLGKQPHTLTTVTRPHNISFALPTKIVHVNPHWPQVGTIVAESDIPERWRETFEMKEQRKEYGTLGAICGIFVLGVLGVLVLAWWKCWWHGDCVCSRRKHKANKRRFDWYG